MSLSTRTKKISGFVTLGEFPLVSKSSIAEKLKAYLASEADQYAFAFHDKDSMDDGSIKTWHVHYVADMSTAKRLSTFVGEIASAIGCSSLAVTISKYVSFEGAFQYLIHKKDTDKFQYAESDIYTNLSEQDFRLYMDCDTGRDDYGKILEACRSADNVTEIISALGLKMFTHYHKAIMLTWEHCVKNKRTNYGRK